MDAPVVFVFQDSVNKRGTGFVQLTSLNHHARQLVLMGL